MSQRAPTPQRFPELCFRTRRLFFFFLYAGENTWLLSGEFIDTLETPSAGILHSTGPLMSRNIVAVETLAVLHRSFRCRFRRGAGGGDPDLHRQAAGRAVPAGGRRGAGLSNRGRRYVSSAP